MVETKSILQQAACPVCGELWQATLGNDLERLAHLILHSIKASVKKEA